MLINLVCLTKFPPGTLGGLALGRALWQPAFGGKFQATESWNENQARSWTLLAGEMERDAAKRDPVKLFGGENGEGEKGFALRVTALWLNVLNDTAHGCSIATSSSPGSRDRKWQCRGSFVVGDAAKKREIVLRDLEGWLDAAQCATHPSVVLTPSAVRCSVLYPLCHIKLIQNQTIKDRTSSSSARYSSRVEHNVLMSPIPKPTLFVFSLALSLKS